ncbi:MAG: cellulase family glycosylhydrolase [Candidatus Moranbacteria bacterium]|nr:cellulase family glycosylhydrolase [Candidatus Moranbacteria bacterium]
MKIRFKKTLLVILIITAGFFYLIRKPSGIVSNAGDIKWGVAFSRIFSVQMGLDWKENYLAILSDLKPDSIRLPIYWQDVEAEEGKYNFDDYDWMIEEAKKRDVELILVIGRKLPRWPECHAPFWADKLPEQEKQEKILAVMSKEVERYKDISNLYLWQVDNEPFLPFGECTTTNKGFLDREVAKVREIDSNHKIMVTDSGELSIWVRAAKRADIFGTTMYRIIYKDPIGYFKYPLPPKFFWLKANIVHLLYPGKPIVVSELQAEPWGPKLINDLSVDEQMKSMDVDQFRENIEYAKKVGFPENYLWGAEWWYWMKEKQNRPEFWEAAKEVLKSE